MEHSHGAQVLCAQLRVQKPCRCAAVQNTPLLGGSDCTLHCVFWEDSSERGLSYTSPQGGGGVGWGGACILKALQTVSAEALGKMGLKGALKLG